jgi:raffinose/stachyose/melibiose transport system permease protein
MNKSKTYPWSFAAFALVIYTVLFVLPGLIGIGYSFTDWSAYKTEVNFVGLENFKTVFSTNENYLKYIGNTLLFTVVTTVEKTVIGLLLAIILAGDVKFRNFHRSVMYIPSVLSILIIGLIFRSILNPRYGLLNNTLRAIGADFLVQNWLTDPRLVFWSVMGVDVWRGIGYIMVILIVGILSIPKQFYEAAEIDGASGWNKFVHITIPLLMQTLAVVIVLNILYGLKVFDMVYALTNGGPGHITEVMYTSVFKQFSQGFYAIGTTVSSVMFIFMIIIGFFLVKFFYTKEDC